MRSFCTENQLVQHGGNRTRKSSCLVSTKQPKSSKYRLLNANYYNAAHPHQAMATFDFRTDVLVNCSTKQCIIKCQEQLSLAIFFPLC
ncbi:hypothetical protein FDUTEX481_09184 [Tolypothrix sp. PCC 7601]|nr:hypothetical protein FDUTEX481_09184 [Tolypothrix sp. PCC 7601]